MRDYQRPAQADTIQQIDADEQLTDFEAHLLIQAMRDAVCEVPSYVEVQAYRNWLENRMKEAEDDA